MTLKPRVKVPSTARAGDVVTIKALINHQMESGHRTNEEGNIVPRDIIRRFNCEFNNELIFSCDMEPAISTHPYLKFYARVENSGTFKFSWIDDHNEITTAERSIEVSG